jgi:Transport and Golgi organisation 2
MCVLTYIPTENNGFILTSNRDEAVARMPAIPPKKYEINSHYVFFPKDLKGGGTWIASSENFTLCLLNGGFEKHTPTLPYRQSRGKVILDFYNFANVEDFFNDYDFEGIEPFTLVIIESSNQLILNEIRWDGNQKQHRFYPANEAKIWSSVTLYPHEIIQERENWFDEFLSQKTDILPEDILNFHHFGGKGDIRNDILMNRDNVLKTISITQISFNEEGLQIAYQDLQQNKTYNYRVFMECV